MKTAVTIFGVLLLAGLTGCSRDSFVASPVDTSPTGIPGPAFPTGEWILDRLVYDQDGGNVYHVSGNLQYTYAEDGTGFEFVTDVKADIRQLHTPEPGGGGVLESRCEKGSVAKSGKVAVRHAYPLTGLHPSAELVLKYEVGPEGCTLIDLNILFRPIEATEK